MDQSHFHSDYDTNALMLLLSSRFGGVSVCKLCIPQNRKVTQIEYDGLLLLTRYRDMNRQQVGYILFTGSTPVAEQVGLTGNLKRKRKLSSYC